MVWIFKKSQYYQILAILALLVGLLLIIVLGFKAYWLATKSSEEKARIDKATYQAVFLENDQIYFGKLKDIDLLFPVLEDVYYVRLEGEGVSSGRLVKLGEGEPHGPKNEMIINRDHILFWENLRADSQIIQTIRNLKLNQ